MAVVHTGGRNGLYPLWLPVRFLARRDGTAYESEAAAALFAYVEGPVTTPVEKTFLDATIDARLVPQCAMRVGREEALGPLFSVQPEQGCGCYFDARVNGGNTGAPCETSATCPGYAPSCNFGYCEAR